MQRIDASDPKSEILSDEVRELCAAVRNIFIYMGLFGVRRSRH